MVGGRSQRVGPACNCRIMLVYSGIGASVACHRLSSWIAHEFLELGKIRNYNRFKYSLSSKTITRIHLANWVHIRND